MVSLQAIHAAKVAHLHSHVDSKGVPVEYIGCIRIIILCLRRFFIQSVEPFTVFLWLMFKEYILEWLWAHTPQKQKYCWRER